MRTMSGTRGAMMVAGVLVLLGVAALVYAPDNKTALKIGMLVAGVVIGVVTWLWARLRRDR